MTEARVERFGTDELVPEVAVDRVDTAGDRPRLRSEPLVPPHALQEHAQVPVAYAIAEEEKVTRAQLVEKLKRNETLDWTLAHVADVVVLGDDVVLTPRLAGTRPVNRAVNLHDDGARDLFVLDWEPEILVRDGHDLGFPVEDEEITRTIIMKVHGA